MSSDIKETSHTKFHALLRDQIRNEFNASQQYIATAVYFANVDLPQLAKHFYAQSVEERNHAMMIVQYFLDRDITVELTGVDASKSVFTDPREAIALALAQAAINAVLAPLFAIIAEEVPAARKGLAGGLLALGNPVAAGFSVLLLAA